MKKSFLILLVMASAMLSGVSHAQLYGARGAYACSQWERLGSGIGGQKYKRKCQNAQNSFDHHWEVCSPSYSGWDCRNVGGFEPSF